MYLIICSKTLSYRPCLNIDADPEDLKPLEIALAKEHIKETALGMTGTELASKVRPEANSFEYFTLFHSCASNHVSTAL